MKVKSTEYFTYVDLCCMFGDWTKGTNECLINNYIQSWVSQIEQINLAKTRGMFQHEKDTTRKWFTEVLLFLRSHSCRKNYSCWRHNKAYVPLNLSKNSRPIRLYARAICTDEVTCSLPLINNLLEYIIRRM